MKRHKFNKYSPESYDAIYRDSEKYKCHYTKSVYYPLWLSSLKYISGSVIELGCGTGQFAQMIDDNLNSPYTGIDFSEVAIDRAKRVNPSLEFICTDIFLADTSPYDTVIAFEVLEHIEDDLELPESLKQGHKIIFSVPDYMSKNHYRCFKSKDDIRSRYQMLIIFNIEKFELVKNELGATNTLFLVDAIKK